MPCMSRAGGGPRAPARCRRSHTLQTGRLCTAGASPRRWSRRAAPRSSACARSGRGRGGSTGRWAEPQQAARRTPPHTLRWRCTGTPAGRPMLPHARASAHLGPAEAAAVGFKRGVGAGGAPRLARHAAVCAAAELCRLVGAHLEGGAGEGRRPGSMQAELSTACATSAPAPCHQPAAAHDRRTRAHLVAAGACRRVQDVVSAVLAPNAAHRPSLVSAALGAPRPRGAARHWASGRRGRRGRGRRHGRQAGRRRRVEGQRARGRGPSSRRARWGGWLGRGSHALGWQTGSGGLSEQAAAFLCPGSWQISSSSAPPGRSGARNPGCTPRMSAGSMPRS